MRGFGRMTRRHYFKLSEQKKDRTALHAEGPVEPHLDWEMVDHEP